MYPFGCSIWKYALPKFFEAMACRTLVLSDSPAGAGALHFEPGVNFVEISLEDYREKVDYYLENEKERERIVDNAFKMVHRYHTCEIRARELLDYVEGELL